MELSGKTAIVTGSGRGIGKAIAFKLASLGANIVINDIPSSDAADETAKEIEALGREALVVKGDVRVLSDVENLIAKTLEKFNKIDIIVNNAGITRDNLMLKMTEAEWDDVIGINLKGAFNVVKAATRVLMKQRFGVIINMASVVGVMGNAGQVNYSSSKAGLIGLTKSVAKEFASRNIRCNAVAPGFIKSDMTDKLTPEVQENYMKAIPLGRFGQIEDVANVVAFLAGDKSSYVTGQVINVDGGLLM